MPPGLFLLVSQIDNSVCLAYKSLERFGFEETDLALYAEGSLEIVDYLFLKAFNLAVALKQRCVDELNADFKGIGKALTAHNELIVCAYLLCAYEHALDLRREYIYAAYLEHIVAPALDLVHSDSCSSAFAGRIVEPCNIAGSVSEKRNALFSQRGYEQLARFALSESIRRIHRVP